MDNKEIEQAKIEAIEEYEKQLFSMEFAKALNNMGLKTDTRFSASTMKKFGVYTEDQLNKFLESPQSNEKQLREVSRHLANTSFIYQRMCNYLPSIGIDTPIIVPANIDKLEAKKDKTVKDYHNAIKYLDMLNIPHEFIKVKKTMVREDVFYGIEYEDEKNASYYIKQLNPDYCRISSIEDSCFNFEFDFGYFDLDNTLMLLDMYETIIPSFFKSGYTKYKSDKKLYQWQEVPSDKSVCFKMQEDLDYCYPYYVSTAMDVRDIGDYKNLAKVNTEQQNYRLLAFEIPRMNTKSEKPDSFEVKSSTAMKFYNMARQNIDPNIGMFVSPMPVKDISFKETVSGGDKVAKSVKNFYDTVGTSDMLFNGGDNSTSLKYSIKTDEAVLFQMNRQLERWLNRKFKRKFNGTFKVKLLDVTIFNKDDVLDKLLTSAQYGVPVKTQIASLLGEQPLDMLGLTFLENNILDIQSTWIPLSSSHTATGGSTAKGGRPQSEGQDLSESGQRTRDNGTNERE